MSEFMSASARSVAGLLGVVFTLAALPSADLAAQSPFWGERSVLSERQRSGMTFDPLRGRLVLFGGYTGRTGLTCTNCALGDTWEADAAGWVKRTPLSAPSPSEFARGLHYDLPNKRCLYFTYSSSRAAEVWRYNGESWARFLGTTMNPQFRSAYATAFDVDRNVLVLFGGAETSGFLLDVWEFDGTDWRQLATPGPVGRNDPTMVWDGTRGRILVFGGRNAAQQPLNDTWSWDGSAWTQLSPATSPPARHSAGMAYDAARNRVVLFGGANGLPGTRFDDTWEWDGSNWTQINTPNRPAARNGHAMTFRSDRNRVVVAAGDGVANLLSDTWEYDGSNWVATAPAPAPAARNETAACYDRGRGKIVLFGGKNGTNVVTDDTWLWTVSTWSEATPATRPPGRSDHAMAYDEARDRVVMYGGADSSGQRSDTWLWDGTNWTQASPAANPGTRMGHSMVWDSARQVVVLFGGTRLGTVFDDVWEWDGSNWTQRTLTPRPVARWNHGAAFDRVAGVMVVFGGRNAVGGRLNDTWTYNGTTWTQRVVSPAPPARDNHAMGYDERRQRVVVYSGFGVSTYASDTWDWSGTAWNIVPVIVPPARQGMVFAYDAVGRHMVMFSGLTNTGSRQDTWLLTINPQAAVTDHGQPCAGFSGFARITGFGPPVLGSSTFALDLLTPTPPTTVPVFFILTAGSGSVNIGGSCTLSLDPTTIFYTAYRLQFGVGFASMALPIPPNTALLGIEFYGVAAYVDPPTPLNGMAFSRQTRVRIGD